MEAVAIKLMLSNQEIIKIIAAYQQPSRRILEEDLIAIFDDQTPTLLLGDLNSKNQQWGCKSNNPNGIKLEQYCNKHKIHVTAPNEPTHYPYRPDHRPDILDILLQKKNSRPITQTVLCELDSDHAPVIITFSKQPETSPHRKQVTHGKIDWASFQNELKVLLKKPEILDSETDIDNEISRYTATIIKAAQTATYKLRHTKLNLNLTPNYILNNIKEKNKVRRLWQNTRNKTDKRELNRLTHQVRRQLEQHTISQYQNHLSEIKPGDKEMWQATKRILRTPTIIPPLNSDTGTLYTDEEKCNEFATYYENIFKTDNDNPEAETIPPFKNPIINPIAIKWTSPNELKSYINQLINKKSARTRQYYELNSKKPTTKSP